MYSIVFYLLLKVSSRKMWMGTSSTANGNLNFFHHLSKNHPIKNSSKVQNITVKEGSHVCQCVG